MHRLRICALSHTHTRARVRTNRGSAESSTEVCAHPRTCKRAGHAHTHHWHARAHKMTHEIASRRVHGCPDFAYIYALSHVRTHRGIAVHSTEVCAHPPTRKGAGEGCLRAPLPCPYLQDDEWNRLWARARVHRLRTYIRPHAHHTHVRTHRGIAEQSPSSVHTHARTRKHARHAHTHMHT